MAHKTTHLAEYQRLHQQQIAGAAAQAVAEVDWHDKMKQYLENPFPKVNEDTDLVKLWEVHPPFVFHGSNY